MMVRALLAISIVLAVLASSASAQSPAGEAAAAASPAAAPAPCAPDTACAATGTPAPSSAPVAQPGPPGVVAMPVPDPALLARIAALRAERSAIRIGKPIGLVAGGLGLFLAGAALGVQTLLYSEAVGICGFAGCLTTPAASALGGSAAALGVAGIVLIAVGAPMLRARLRARRALTDELRQLMREPQLAFDLRPTRAGLALRAKF